MYNEKGALIDSLPSHVKHTTIYKKRKDKKTKIFRAMLKIANINPLEYQLQRLQQKTNADFWYFNTIVNPIYFKMAAKLGVKIVTHFHELPMAYNLITYDNLEQIMLHSDSFIGCSEIVCQKIKDMGGANVKLLYGFVDGEKIFFTKTAEEVKAGLGFKKSDFVWAISGSTTLIKGIDFLIPLLELLDDDVKILWVGGAEERGTYYYVKKTVETQFPGRVIFTGALETEYYNYLNSGDAFLSLSREDSFPLVMLEAASLGKPIVGFNSGGIKEFVKNDTGIIVEPGNFNGLASAMNVVKNQPEKFNVARIKEEAAKYQVERQIPVLESILEEIKINTKAE
ncbi:glycosyltransferase family 4 protein [Pedobacter frigidisoli]|uniref:glycosyltransferase family 4 protein n=1 Tax=Pedobacter frigidisoli TaxID=2530455 RepID=UPI0013F14E75|nr:glycosyltransferase family 4 protein [Pedobacter frigidisoli]